MSMAEVVNKKFTTTNTFCNWTVNVVKRVLRSRFETTEATVAICSNAQNNMLDIRTHQQGQFNPLQGPGTESNYGPP